MFVLIFALAVLSAGSVFGAPKYEVDFDKCDIVSYNKSVMDNWVLTFNKINNTAFTVNSESDLLIPINLDAVKATAQVYHFEDNEYKINPKLKITMNTCHEYKMQTIANWKEVEKYGNLKGCGKLEPGKIHIKDYPPQVRMFDIAVPTGKYKVNVKIHIDETEICEVDFYSHIIGL